MPRPDRGGAFELPRPSSRKGTFYRVLLRAMRLVGPMSSYEVERIARACGLSTGSRPYHNMGYLIAPCSGTHGPGGLLERTRLPFPVRWDDVDRTRFCQGRYIYWASAEALRRLAPELRTGALPPAALEALSGLMPELVRMRRHWRASQDRAVRAAAALSGAGALSEVDWRPTTWIPEDHHAL